VRWVWADVACRDRRDAHDTADRKGGSAPPVGSDAPAGGPSGSQRRSSRSEFSAVSPSPSRLWGPRPASGGTPRGVHLPGYFSGDHCRHGLLPHEYSVGRSYHGHVRRAPSSPRRSPPHCAFPVPRPVRRRFCLRGYPTLHSRRSRVSSRDRRPLGDPGISSDLPVDRLSLESLRLYAIPVPLGHPDSVHYRRLRSLFPVGPHQCRGGACLPPVSTWGGGESCCPFWVRAFCS